MLENLKIISTRGKIQNMLAHRMKMDASFKSCEITNNDLKKKENIN